nr:uncharacterized protein LOC111423965 [Onthophagus taurus]
MKLFLVLIVFAFLIDWTITKGTSNRDHKKEHEESKTHDKHNKHKIHKDEHKNAGYKKHEEKKVKHDEKRTFFRGCNPKCILGYECEVRAINSRCVVRTPSFQSNKIKTTTPHYIPRFMINGDPAYAG